MAKIKNDDCLLVGRDGVDYKVTYEELVDGIDLAPAGINEVLAAGNETDFGQHIRFKSTADSIPATFREQLLPDGTEIDFSGGSGNYVGPLVSYHLISEPFKAEAGGSSLDIDYASARTTAVDTYYRSGSGDEFYDASVGLTGFNYNVGSSFLSINPGLVQIIGNKDWSTGNHGLNIECSDWNGTKIECQGPITANEFIGDGSKLTGLPSGGGGSISEVLAEGNTADPGQSLHFRIEKGDIPPIKRDIIDIDGGSGLRLGGLVSYYTINEAFTIDTDHGATDIAGCLRRITADGDYFYADLPNGKSLSAGTGISGISFNGDTGYFSVSNGTGVLMVGDYDAPLLKIEARTYDGTSSITAGEFIGDGSKLTNLPGGSTTWNDITGKPSEFPPTAHEHGEYAPTAHEHGEYAKLSDATQSITAKEFIGDGSRLTGVGLPDFRTLTPLT